MTASPRSERPGGSATQPWWARPLRWLRAAAVVYLLLLLAAMWFEKSLIFFPQRFPAGDWSAGEAFEDARFSSADGTSLHGWFAPREYPKVVILFCHGNAGNVTQRAAVVDHLNRRLDAAVLVFDYRGYGQSEGKPSEQGVYVDARAARAWLAKRTGVAENEIVLMGRSLGGAVAVELAATDGARALILESTFSSLPDVAASHYPIFPVRLLMRTRMDSIAKIVDYNGPLLQSHSHEDTVIPHIFGRRLFDTANEPKRFFPIHGRDHNDPQPPEYYDVLAEFVDALPPE